MHTTKNEIKQNLTIIDQTTDQNKNNENFNIPKSPIETPIENVESGNKSTDTIDKIPDVGDILDESFQKRINEIYKIKGQISQLGSLIIPDYHLYRNKHLDKQAEKLNKKINEEHNEYLIFLKASQNFTRFITNGLYSYIENSKKILDKTLEENEKWRNIEKKDIYYNSNMVKEEKYLKFLFEKQINDVYAIMKSVDRELTNQKKKIEKDIKLLKDGSIFEKIAILTGFKKIGELTDAVDYIQNVENEINAINNRKADNIKIIDEILGDKINDMESYYKDIMNIKEYLAINYRAEQKDGKNKNHYKLLSSFKSEYNNILKMRQEFAKFIYKGVEEYKKEAEIQIKDIIKINSRNTNSEIHYIVENYKSQIKIINLLLMAELQDLIDKRKKIEILEEIANSGGLKKIKAKIHYYLIY